MRAVTKPGPQPPSCCVEDCDRDPAPGDVMCKGHLKLTQNQNGSPQPQQPNTTPIVQPDDPRLLEAAQKQAAEQEAQEYAERRRVKEWEVLDNGLRRPLSYWSEEELAQMDAEEERHVAELAERIKHLETNRVDVDVVAQRSQAGILRAYPQAASGVQQDPTKAQAKLFRKALKGKLGPVAEHTARMCLYVLENQGA